jgi:HEAT repeat protein
MDKHEELMVRGEEAARLLANPMLTAAFDDTRRALLEALAGLESLRDERATELHCMVRSLSKVRKCIDEHITTGKLARVEVEGRKKGILQQFRRQA